MLVISFLLVNVVLESALTGCATSFFLMSVVFRELRLATLFSFILVNVELKIKVI